VVCIFQLRGEKLQEEKDCDDQIHKLLQEDSEMGKRKADEQKKRDEAVVLKTSLEQVSGSRMSGGHCLEQVSGSRMSGGHCLEQVSGSRLVDICLREPCLADHGTRNTH
jgi:hypothetical protein